MILFDRGDELAARAEVERLSRVEAALEKWKTKAAKEDTHWTYFILDSASKGLGPAEAGCDVAILSGLGPDGKPVKP